MSQQPRNSHGSRGRRVWHALSVRLAFAIIVLGAAFWGYNQASESASAQMLGEYGPAMMRFGGSFIAGFLLGWLLRRFLKWTLIVVGLLALAIFILKRTDLIDLPWDRLESEIREGTDWLHQRADSVKTVITGYLPSTAAAVIGVFLGFLRR